MPKVGARSTVRHYQRLDRIRAMDHVVKKLCRHCAEKKLRCLLSLEGQCLDCIAVGVECSLFPREEEFAALAWKRRELRRELLEIERRKLDLEDQLQSTAEEEKRLFDSERKALNELELLEKKMGVWEGPV
jgi:hypothetical protein